MGCIGRAILPIGVYNRRKEEKKLAVPRATVAYGRQLKILPDRPDVHGLRIPAWFGTNADLHKSIIKAAIKIRAALSPIAVVK